MVPQPIPPLTGSPIAGTPPISTGPRCRLIGTSQGRREDIPPEDWIQEELIRYKVTGTKNLRPANLTGTPHPIFARARWPKMNDTRFKAMNQSILLASTLLEMGIPYLASWLPEANYAEGYNPAYNPARLYDRVDIIPNPSADNLQLTRKELNEISKCLEWYEDSEIFQNNGWWGITTSAYPRITENFGRVVMLPKKETDKALIEDGYNRRQNTIGFASQYIDTLLGSDRASEQHLCATFHLAVTLVHEIAHVAYWQNLKHQPGPMGFEPVVGDQIRRELGFAFTAWLFDGYNPNPIMDDDKSSLFNRGSFWNKQELYGQGYRPEWKRYYSMPFACVQRLLTQSTWDAWVGNLFNPAARAILKAPSIFQYGQNARVAICEQSDTYGTGTWRFKRILDMIAIPFKPKDDSEDWGQNLPGIPPFGFEDDEWTAGPDSEVYEDWKQQGTTHDDGSDEDQFYPSQKNPPAVGPQKPTEPNIKVTQTETLAVASPKPTNPKSNVTQTGTSAAAAPNTSEPSTERFRRAVVYYSGVYDEATGTIQPPSMPASAPRPLINMTGQIPATQFRYTGWPEGVLRNVCSQRDLPTTGGREELIARLRQLGWAEKGKSASEEPAEVMDQDLEDYDPEEDEVEKLLLDKIRGWPARIELNAQMQRSVDIFKLQILTETDIPMDRQRLMLNNTVMEQRAGSQVPTTLNTWRDLPGWDRILLFRIQRAPKGDPGRLEQVQRPKLPSDVPDYIQRLLPLPDVSVESISSFGTTALSWTEKLRQYVAYAEDLEKANGGLRKTMGDEDVVSGNHEYSEYISLLEVINRVLSRKQIERRTAAAADASAT